MDLRRLSDRDLLVATKRLAQIEREIITKVLHHLCEVERRRLYADLGLKSLFDYAMKELGYSEGQAYRRIAAMRLIEELPEVEKKIASGQLNLSNISQAQTFFRAAKDKQTRKGLDKSEKLNVLEKLENRSTRDAQKELVKMQPAAALPKERRRIITEDHTQISLVIDSDLQKSLEEVRSLLGPKGASMNLAELFSEMSIISVESLKAKKFGKKRSRQMGSAKKSTTSKVDEAGTTARSKVDGAGKTATSKVEGAKGSASMRVNTGRNNRYISQADRYYIWNRDKGCCTNCGSRQNLNIDHIVPVALGGSSSRNNLRLLCFGCNQRAGMKIFGVERMRNEAGVG